MSDKQDEKLDAMLRSRRVESAGRDLAQRIILRSQSLPQNQTLPLIPWLRQLFAEFHLPKPAYVVVSALVLGMIVGFSTPDRTASKDEESASVQSFLYADEVPIMSKTVKLVFLASLVLNVLLVGVLLGRLPRDVGFVRQQRMEQALKDVPEPTQTRLREKFKQMRAAGDPLRDQIRVAREETLNILTADPFDEAAYDRHVSQIDDLQLQMFKKMGQVVKEIAKELPPEERRLFVQILRRPPPPLGEYAACSESPSRLKRRSYRRFFWFGSWARRLSLRHSY